MGSTHIMGRTMFNVNQMNQKKLDDIKDVARSTGIIEELETNLKWLDDYGGHKWRCSLYVEMNPATISFYMYEGGDYRFGGEIRLQKPKKHSICDTQCHFRIHIDK